MEQPWLNALLFRGAAAPPAPVTLPIDQLQALRRTVAETYRRDGAEALARMVELGFGDGSQRMKGAIAAAHLAAQAAAAAAAEARAMPAGLVRTLWFLLAVMVTAFAMGVRP